MIYFSKITNLCMQFIPHFKLGLFVTVPRHCKQGARRWRMRTAIDSELRVFIVSLRSRNKRSLYLGGAAIVDGDVSEKWVCVHVGRNIIFKIHA